MKSDFQVAHGEKAADFTVKGFYEGSIYGQFHDRNEKGFPNQ